MWPDDTSTSLCSRPFALHKAAVGQARQHASCGGEGRRGCGEVVSRQRGSGKGTHPETLGTAQYPCNLPPDPLDPLEPRPDPAGPSVPSRTLLAEGTRGYRRVRQGTDEGTEGTTKRGYRGTGPYPGFRDLWEKGFLSKASLGTVLGPLTGFFFLPERYCTGHVNPCFSYVRTHAVQWRGGARTA